MLTLALLLAFWPLVAIGCAFVFAPIIARRLG
jgi:hypothetical protein